MTPDEILSWRAAGICLVLWTAAWCLAWVVACAVMFAAMVLLVALLTTPLGICALGLGGLAWAAYRFLPD